MGLWELFLVALGLSMDAFAVSLGKGLCMRKLDVRYTFVISALFGGFQALMPIFGWALGQQFSQVITRYGHWVAFFLLGFIGGKMIVEALESRGKDEACELRFDWKELLALSVATSLDALAVGVSFAALNMSILPSALLIGVVTFVICLSGVAAGNRFGVKYKMGAEIAGGVVLLLIGLKILIGG